MVRDGVEEARFFDSGADKERSCRSAPTLISIRKKKNPNKLLSAGFSDPLMLVTASSTLIPSFSHRLFAKTITTLKQYFQLYMLNKSTESFDK